MMNSRFAKKKTYEWQPDDLALRFFWGEVAYTRKWGEIDHVLAPHNVRANHWILLDFDIKNETINVYNSIHDEKIASKLRAISRGMASLWKYTMYHTWMETGQQPKDQWDIILQKSPQQRG